MMEVYDGKWLKRRLAERPDLLKSQVADRIGISRDKISKVLALKRELRPVEIAALLELFDTKTGPASRPSGFAEGDTTPFALAAAMRTESGKTPLADLLAALAPGARHVQTHTVNRPVSSLALREGDILVLELNGKPVPGDLLVVQIIDPDHAAATTSLREYLPPNLVSREADNPRPVIALDDQTASIAGIVRASLRAPLLKGSAAIPPKAT